MIEFSLRTHQPDREALARDYEPPVIDVAATPIRVEKRRVEGRLEYRVVGIVWGGERPVERLAIRFNVGEAPRCSRSARRRRRIARGRCGTTGGARRLRASTASRCAPPTRRSAPVASICRITSDAW